MSVTALVVAAGRGTRLGSVVPKGFVPLAGVPLFVWSLRRLAAAEGVGAAIVVVPPGHEAEARRVLDRHWTRRGVQVEVAPGGAERSDSVRLGLACVRTSLVAVHDAARPLVSPEVTGRVIGAAGDSGAAIAAVRATDTIKRVDGRGRVLATVPREELWAARTPQVFRTDLLVRAHAQAAGRVRATDDAMLVERLGVPVRVVEDVPENRKITTPDDLAWAEWWLRRSEGPR